MDYLLTVAVGLIQLLLALLGVYVSMKPQPSERHRVLIAGFIVLALTGIGLNVYQQARAAREAKSDRQDAVSQTSSEVSGRVSEAVSKSLSRQYQGTINTLQSQIATLQSQLAAQGKKVDIIGNSDIVTGKKPIPVVVQNQQPSPPTEEPLKIYASQMPVEPNTKYGAFASQYILTTK